MSQTLKIDRSILERPFDFLGEKYTYNILKDCTILKRYKQLYKMESILIENNVTKVKFMYTIRYMYEEVVEIFCVVEDEEDADMVYKNYYDSRSPYVKVQKGFDIEISETAKKEERKREEPEIEVPF